MGEYRISGVQVIETRFQAWAIIACARCLILIDVSFINRGIKQCVPLQIGRLPIGG
jgi:hypothetical protein